MNEIKPCNSSRVTAMAQLLTNHFDGEPVDLLTDLCHLLGSRGQSVEGALEKAMSLFREERNPVECHFCQGPVMNRKPPEELNICDWCSACSGEINPWLSAKLETILNTLRNRTSKQ